MITRENCEEYMMMHADGELRPDEVRELMAFVNKYPELKKEMALYEQVHLAPDTTQVFANKDSLLKPVPATRIIAFPQWRRYSIAAGIAALIFISLFRYTTKDNNNIEVAKTDTLKPSNIYTGPPAVATTNILPEHNNKPVVKPDVQPVKADAHKNTGIAIVHKATKGLKMQNVLEHAPGRRPGTTTNNELQLVSIKQLSCNKNKPEMQPIKDIPEYTIANNNEEVKKTFWDKLPIDDIKKRQLEHIAGAAADVYKDVSAAKQDLYDKSISIEVKIEKSKLVISF
jgi:hypothetical protein